MLERGWPSVTLPAVAFAIALAVPAQAEESATPFIDSVKQEMRDRGQSETSTSEGYTEQMKRELEAEPSESSEGYTERARQELPPETNAKGGSLTESEKARLGPSHTDSAIQAVNEGRSELHEQRNNVIHHAAGLRYGVSLNRDVTAVAGASLRSFDSIYGGNYAPDLQVFYEYQPWHSEWVGSLGIFAQGGVSYFHGKGTYEFSPNRPGGGTYGTEAKTDFRFFTIPATIGLNYRFNLLRILRPYVMAGPTLVGYIEGRNDEGGTRLGSSGATYFSGGVSILLDWISHASSRDLYHERGVKHYYLTVDYSRLSTFSGNVRFTISGVFAGLTFEF